MKKILTVSVANHKVITPVEISDHNTLVETDVYGIHDSSNVSNDAIIGDTVR